MAYGAMSAPMTHPYSLEILPCDRQAGYFMWAIYENRRLFQSCDRPLPTSRWRKSREWQRWTACSSRRPNREEGIDDRLRQGRKRPGADLPDLSAGYHFQ